MIYNCLSIISSCILIIVAKCNCESAPPGYMTSVNTTNVYFKYFTTVNANLGGAQIYCEGDGASLAKLLTLDEINFAAEILCKSPFTHVTLSQLFS